MQQSCISSRIWQTQKRFTSNQVQIVFDCEAGPDNTALRSSCDGTFHRQPQYPAYDRYPRLLPDQAYTYQQGTEGWYVSQRHIEMYRIPFPILKPAPGLQPMDNLFRTERIPSFAS